MHAQVSKTNESHALAQQKQTTDDETSSRSPGPAGGLLSIDAADPFAFDQVDQTVLPWKVPGPEDVGLMLESARQDLVTIVPALEHLRQTIPSLETLGNERDQGASGKAVSSLIFRVQQITPKSRALQDHDGTAALRDLIN